VEKFIINFSDKDIENAIKEISIKIKSSLSGPIKIFFIFFTPHYNPSILLENIKYILNPEFIFGLQSPYLIFEDKILEKGLISLCINKNMDIKYNFIKENNQNTIESSLRKFSLKLREKKFFLSLVSKEFNIYETLRAFELVFGFGNTFGGGFLKKYSDYPFKIINDDINEGFLTLALSDSETSIYKISGFMPVGKPFVINKVSLTQRIIKQINNDEPIKIFKNYFGDKSEFLKKNKLLNLYPFIVKEKNKPFTISVTDALDDGTLFYIGDIKKNTKANIAIYNPNIAYEEIKNIKLNEDKETLLIIINTTIRKKILKNYADKEIFFIKNNISYKYKVIGFYLDYSFLSNEILRRIILDSTSLMLIFLK